MAISIALDLGQGRRTRQIRFQLHRRESVDLPDGERCTSRFVFALVGVADAGWGMSIERRHGAATADRRGQVGRCSGGGVDITLRYVWGRAFTPGPEN